MTTNHSLAETLPKLASAAQDDFVKAFGNKPTITVAAPGRVNLIGEHVDYNDGIVLPFAIERNTVIAGSPSTDADRCRLISRGFGKGITIDLSAELKPQPGCWTNYVAGVIAGFQKAGHRPSGFDIAVCSDIPLGAGLSSSAALEVAVATFLEALIGVELDKREKALICQRAEHTFAGMPCGIMDQFASTFGEHGHLVKIDCQSQKVETIPFSNDQITFLIVDSKTSHELADGEYRSRREQCESGLAKLDKASFRGLTMAELDQRRSQLTEVEYRRARHVVSEIERTHQVLQCISVGAWDEIGQLLYQSHASLRDDFEVSCKELDALVEIASSLGRSNGVFGSRMTGGGFGGATISMVETNQLDKIADNIHKSYQAKIGVAPDIFASKPNRGAHLIERK